MLLHCPMLGKAFSRHMIVFTDALIAILTNGVCVVAVAVVVAFFICWAPFHAQRLMTVYIREDQWTPLWLELQSHLFYISGIVF